MRAFEELVPIVLADGEPEPEPDADAPFPPPNSGAAVARYGQLGVIRAEPGRRLRTRARGTTSSSSISCPALARA